MLSRLSPFLWGVLGCSAIALGGYEFERSRITNVFGSTTSLKLIYVSRLRFEDHPEGDLWRTQKGTMREGRIAKHGRPSRRGGLILSTGMLGLVSLLLLAAPMASAAGAQAVFKTPYTGTPQVGTFMSTSGCGGTLAVPSWPNFNLTTGLGIESANATANHCPDLSGTDSAGILSYLGYNGSAFTQTKTGSHSVIAQLSFSWKAVTKAKAGSSTQSADASISVYAIVELVDQTNQTTPATGLVFVLSMYVTSGSTTSSKTGVLFNATSNSAKLVKNHHYSIEVIVYVDVSASVTAVGKSTASAGLNLATGGDDFKLVSVTVK